MGTIEAIAETDYYTPESKVHLIRETINALSHVRTDESLPWHEQRKAPLPEGATEETIHPDCIINITNGKSNLEPWYVEYLTWHVGKKGGVLNDKA